MCLIYINIYIYFENKVEIIFKKSIKFFILYKYNLTII